MGTVAYMSPEQAQGMEVDSRSDIWSLGVVLYEMVRGQRPFQGEYDQALLFEIVHQEPEPLTGVRAGVPMQLEFIVGKCLAKDTESRYQHAGEIVVDLRNLQDKLKSGQTKGFQTGDVSGIDASASLSQQTSAPLESHPLVKYRVIENIEASEGSVQYLAEDTQLHRSVAIRVLPQSTAEQVERAQRRNQTIAYGVGALGVLLGLILALFGVFGVGPDTEAPLRRFAITPDALSAATGWRASISPNGRHIVYVAGREGSKLWVRDLHLEQPREMDGTEGASSPFWSPDSQFIGFFVDDRLKKIPVQGGSATTLSTLSTTNSRAGAWSPDGEAIVFSADGPAKVHEVPARGGSPSLWLEMEEGGITSTHFLPTEAGVRGVIFDLGNPTEREIVV